MENKVITVTSPLLPSLDDFIPYLQDIWNRKWLTNNGHYHQELETPKVHVIKHKIARVVLCVAVALKPREIVL